MAYLDYPGLTRFKSKLDTEIIEPIEGRLTFVEEEAEHPLGLYKDDQGYICQSEE